MSELRPELEPLPLRMMNLPVDRGYPVPWFVEWIINTEGERVPEFRAMSQEKWHKAVRQSRCWVCGERLGKNLAFVIGPMCGITRTTGEPPCHLECAEWSVRNCPFLARPHAERRELEGPLLPSAGIMIERNPGVSLVWVTNSYTLFRDANGLPLIKVGPPERITFWSEGKPATRAQIDTSISTGLPLLEAVAESPEERTALSEQVTALQTLLPPA